MASHGQKLTYRIGHRAGKQGPRPSVGNQAEVEKSATGTNSPHHASEDFHSESNPQSGPHETPSHNPCKASRQKWSRGEYKEVMEAFYAASLNNKTSITQGTYDIWRANNPTKRLNLNGNKLANVRRDIVNRERLTKVELQAIQLKVKQRDENPTPCETDENVTPEERHANKNRENDKQPESLMQEQLNIDVQDETVNVMKESILQRYEIAMETPISQRPPIPKIKNTQSTKTAIDMANKAIDQIKEESGKLSLTDINHLMYATASAVTESLGMKTKKKVGCENPINQNGKRKLKYAKSGVTYLR